MWPAVENYNYSETPSGVRFELKMQFLVHQTLKCAKKRQFLHTTLSSVHFQLKMAVFVYHTLNVHFEVKMALFVHVTLT